MSNPVQRLEYLEEMFQDQLEFKIAAILSFIRLKRKNKLEIESYFRYLRDLTKENKQMLAEMLGDPHDKQ